MLIDSNLFHPANMSEEGSASHRSSMSRFRRPHRIVLCIPFFETWIKQINGSFCLPKWIKGGRDLTRGFSTQKSSESRGENSKDNCYCFQYEEMSTSRTDEVPTNLAPKSHFFSFYICMSWTSIETKGPTNIAIMDVILHTNII